MTETVFKHAYNVSHGNRTKMLSSSHRTSFCTKYCRETIEKLNLEKKMRDTKIKSDWPKRKDKTEKTKNKEDNRRLDNCMKQLYGIKKKIIF